MAIVGDFIRGYWYMGIIVFAGNHARQGDIDDKLIHFHMLFPCDVFLYDSGRHANDLHMIRDILGHHGAGTYDGM